MDTGNDPRLAVAERALEDLDERIQHGHIQAQYDQKGARAAIDRGLNALKQLKYTYAEPDQLVAMEAFDELLAAVDDVEAALGGEGFYDEIEEDALAVARARWTIDTIRSLEERIHLEGQELETAVEVRPGRILSTREHPEADLVLTRVAAGRSLPVVTNDLSVADDDQVGVALLPPTEIHGALSEAMFLGASDGVLTGVEEGAGGRPDVPDEAYNETRNMLDSFLEG